MRPDLAKCTTESLRSGGAYAVSKKYGGRVKIDPDPEADYLDETGGFHSSARHRQYDHKHLTDALGALRGNIRANVGRLWSQVYSEFCRSLDRRSVSGYHIWTHLMQEVEVNTYMTRRGEVYCLPKFGGPSKVRGYYVHPDSGLLLDAGGFEGRRYWRKQKIKLEDVKIPVPNTPGWEYRWIDGLWFRVYDTKPDRYLRAYLTPTEAAGEFKRWSANKREIRWIRQELKKLPLTKT